MVFDYVSGQYYETITFCKQDNCNTCLEFPIPIRSESVNWEQVDSVINATDITTSENTF